MSVYQVEEYYIYMDIDMDDKEKIEEFLNDEGYSDYSFDDNTLTVDGLCSEYDAESLESKIVEIGK